MIKTSVAERRSSAEPVNHGITWRVVEPDNLAFQQRAQARVPLRFPVSCAKISSIESIDSVAARDFREWAGLFGKDSIGFCESQRRNEVSD